MSKTKAKPHYKDSEGNINLITQIDNYLLDKEHKLREAHYPSDISDCMRKLYYKWTQEPESNPITASGLPVPSTRAKLRPQPS